MQKVIGMEKVSVREARERLAHLLDSVASGEEVVIVRRGKPAARLTAVRKPRWQGFPDRSALRASVPKSVQGAAQAVRKLRDSERF
jgi:prevent-host-death family protein